jgi:hypothetical protein
LQGGSRPAAGWWEAVGRTASGGRSRKLPAGRALEGRRWVTGAAPAGARPKLRCALAAAIAAHAEARGSAAGEPRGCGRRPPWVDCSQCVKILAAKLAQYRRTALRAPRCREPWPGSMSLKTVGAQFSVLHRTCSVSELCIISLHANK